MARETWTEDKLNILVTYLRNSVSRKDIARKLNVSVDTISGTIRRYNLAEHVVAKSATVKFLQNIELDNLNDENFEQLKKDAKLKWEIQKTKIDYSNKKLFEIALFIPDVHAPHHNPSVCKSVLKLMNDIKFDKIIIMGDFMDYGCISHWNKNRHKTLEMKRLKTDYIIGNAILDEFDTRLPKKCDKYFLKGNHERWIDDLLEEMPALEGLIEPEEMLYLKDRNYKIFQYNELVKLGRLFVTHGIYSGSNSIKKHIDELKTNILFAHSHTLGMQLSSSPARDIAFVGYNVGCLCDLAPDYMKSKPNSWTHGFAIGFFYPDGYFDIQLIRIIRNKFIFNNKIYDGNVK
jgi:predicted phosphodiesterase